MQIKQDDKRPTESGFYYVHDHGQWRVAEVTFIYKWVNVDDETRKRFIDDEVEPYVSFVGNEDTCDIDSIDFFGDRIDMPNWEPEYEPEVPEEPTEEEVATKQQSIDVHENYLKGCHWKIGTNVHGSMAFHSDQVFGGQFTKEEYFYNPLNMSTNAALSWGKETYTHADAVVKVDEMNEMARKRKVDIDAHT